MYDENNIFAKILRQEIPCKKLYEDEYSLFFHDINPKAEIHVLGIPKVKCINFFEFIKNSDENYVIKFFQSVNKVVEKLNINETGYTIVSNSGEDGGQEVPHFHIHILGGKKLKNL